MTKIIAAKIEGSNISLLDLNGNRVTRVTTSLNGGENWEGAYVNGDIVVGTTSRGSVVTWELRDKFAPICRGRR